jgi:hypothetical protein
MEVFKDLLTPGYLFYQHTLVRFATKRSQFKYDIASPFVETRTKEKGIGLNVASKKSHAII